MWVFKAKRVVNCYSPKQIMKAHSLVLSHSAVLSTWETPALLKDQRPQVGCTPVFSLVLVVLTVFSLGLTVQYP
jgi:hypothetical protein